VQGLADRAPALVGIFQVHVRLRGGRMGVIAIDFRRYVP